MSEIEDRYSALKLELHRDTAIHSNPNMWLRHRAYKEIVALGQAVVSCILSDLKKSLETGRHEDYPGWWVMYALPDITGDRIPVGGKEVVVEGGFAKVSVDDVSRWWVEWGRQRNLL